MLTDSTIWNDFRNGKGYALSYIYGSQIEHLYRYGRKFSKDEGLIQDTIQEVFFHLIRNRATLGETNNIRFYLMSAFKHRIFRSIKNGKHFDAMDEEGYSSALSITYSYEDELISQEIDGQRVEAIRNVLGKISPKQREILYYRYTCDYSYEEICTLMSIKYDSARKMVFRALTSIREHLDHAEIIFLFMISKKS